MLLLIALFPLVAIPASSASSASAAVLDTPRLIPALYSLHSATRSAQTETYKVRSGDTLSVIGARLDRTWQQLAGANKLTNPNLILTGQVLKIPPASYVAPATVSAAPEGARHSPGPTTTWAAPPPAVSYGASGSFQSCVEFRESTNGQGSPNLYGILSSTWASLGLSGSPYTATPAQQNAAFQELYARDGVSPWAPYDGC